MDSSQPKVLPVAAYLNDSWKDEEEGGALRCFPRTDTTTNDVTVGARGTCRSPVFLDCFHPSGGAALYRVVGSSSLSSDEDCRRRILSVRDFDVPPQPIKFA